VREERVLLKDQTDSTRFTWNDVLSILEDADTIDSDVSCLGTDEAGDGAKERGLSATRLTDECDKLACTDAQAEV